jgi:hypothetical protein
VRLLFLRRTHKSNYIFVPKADILPVYYTPKISIN